MATTELLPSPVSRSVTAEPILVESSDSEDDREPQRKRRRTTYNSEEGDSPSSDVIDLTEVDDQHNASPQDDQIRFAFLPKLIRLTPFKFSEDDDDESTVVRLESLRDHLKSFFTRPEDVPRDVGSPINPDELEIIGVKSSHPSTSTTSSSSSSSSSQRTTSTSTTTSTTTSTKDGKDKDKGKTAQSSSAEKENKENNGGLGNLECAICLGPMTGITATTCGHIFCLKCIKQAIQITKCCPLCKKKLTLKSIHPLYL